MAALDFPNTPSVGQIATLTNGIAYRWDGAVWTAGGALPTMLPPSGPAGGDLTGTYPNPTVTPAAKSKWTSAGSALAPVDATQTVTLGARTIKQRIIPYPTADVALWSINSQDVGGTWVKDDLSQSGWFLVLDVSLNDAFRIYRSPAGTAIPDVRISVLADGRLTLGADPLAALDATTKQYVDAKATQVAGGDLAGTYPNPTVDGLNGATVGTTTPLARGDLLVGNATPALTRLALGTVTQVLQSNGTDVVWGPAPATGGPPTGTAGGDLSGSYPNPQLAAGVIVDADVSATAAIQYSKLTGTPTALPGPPTGAAGGSLAGTYPNPTLTATGVTAAAYGDQYNVAKVTVTAEGRVTAVVPTLIRARWG